MKTNSTLKSYTTLKAKKGFKKSFKPMKNKGFNKTPTDIQKEIKEADSIVSLGLLVVGCYLFFWKQEWIIGAILIAVHQFYQIGTVYCLKNLSQIKSE